MRLFLPVAAALVLCAAAAQAYAAPKALSEAQAHAVIDPWYSQFAAANRGDPKTVQAAVVSPDYQTCNGYLPAECWGREASIKTVTGLSQAIPDLNLLVKEVIISGDRVTVLGEVTGTPAGDLFGVPHTGKSFKIMFLDLQTIHGGKLVRTVH